MPKPAAFNPLRFITPCLLLVCVALFFLSLLEIQIPDFEKMRDGPRPDTKNAKDVLRNAPRTALFSQSGFQAATGDYTIANAKMREAMEKSKQAMREAGMADKMKDDGPKAAPLLWVYLLAVLAGVVLGFVLPPGVPRKALLVSCCGVGLGLLGIQAVVGFPIAKEMKEKGGAGGMRGAPEAGITVDDIVKTRYQVPFYLTLVLLVGGIVTAAIEPTTGPKPPRRKKRRPRDEEDDDDEDDRPRARRDYEVVEDDEDDDEDDRPRRRRSRRDDD